jgi:hypothetical protein
MPLPTTGPTLRDFLLRSQARQLYRDWLRTCTQLKQTGDALTAAELRRWIRYEFKQYRGELDQDKIKSALAHGRTQLRQVQTSLALANGK